MVYTWRYVWYWVTWIWRGVGKRTRFCCGAQLLGCLWLQKPLWLSSRQQLIFYSLGSHLVYMWGTRNIHARRLNVLITMAACSGRAPLQPWFNNSGRWLWEGCWSSSDAKTHRVECSGLGWQSSEAWLLSNRAPCPDSPVWGWVCLVDWGRRKRSLPWVSRWVREAPEREEPFALIELSHRGNFILL